MCQRKEKIDSSRCPGRIFTMQRTARPYEEHDLPKQELQKSFCMIFSLSVGLLDEIFLWVA
jgi:hypothetical protein